MTVSTSISTANYTANGSTTTFAYPFKIFVSSDLVVSLRNTTTGVETVQVLNSAYTVTGAGNNAGGNVVFGTAPASGNTVLIRRELPLTQETDFVPNDPFPAAAHENALDKLTMLLQQTGVDADRAIVFPASEIGLGLTNVLPLVATRANKVLGFTGSGGVTTSTNTLVQFDAAVSSFVNATGNNATSIFYDPAGSAAQQTTVQAKLRELVSVKDFGAVGDGVTDDYAAFLAASTYCNDNDVHSLLIPPASYHLSEPWFVPTGGNYVLCRTVADGAIVDNTVIAQSGAGIAGLTVDGAPDAGFVFTRGQGAYHEYLVAKNCDSYGFYFGVASRQHLTVASSSGFQVGETVTGATSGKNGVVERIDGNVLRLVKCNIAGTAGFFTSSETVTGGTSGASTTVSSVSTPYGGNYQVTRATFNQLLAYNNANKGFYWDGTATANRSWMNANTLISPSGVSNGSKGWVVAPYTGPGGSSEHNYNTFININMEGNADKSLVDPNGRQNTYIGGHFVDTDGGGESVEITDAYNFILGGRYIGSQDLSGVSFSFYNSDVGAIKSRISGVNSFSTDDLDAANAPLFYKGWSILPSSKLTYTVASDNINNHTLAINMGDFINGNYISMRVFIGGFRNQSSGYDQTDHTQLTMVMSSQAGSATTHHVSHAVASTEGISVDSVTISTAGVITITFDTTNQIFTTQNVVEFYSNDPVDPR